MSLNHKNLSKLFYDLSNTMKMIGSEYENSTHETPAPQEMKSNNNLEQLRERSRQLIRQDKDDIVEGLMDQYGVSNFEALSDKEVRAMLLEIEEFFIS